MAKQPLKAEYALMVERAIEDYKGAVPRAVLLAIGDEAVAALGPQAQASLTELLVWEEVDRIIVQRLKLPTFATWTRRRRRHLAALRDATRCGLSPNGAVASALRSATGSHVLLAGRVAEEATLFSAAHGCTVTVLTQDPETLDQLLAAADDIGVGSQVRGCVCEFGCWTPDVPLHVVVCAPDALSALSASERAEAVAGLRSATPVGGVHLLHSTPTKDGDASAAISFDEWMSWYGGWSVTTDDVPHARAGHRTLVARHSAREGPAAAW